MSLTRGEIMKIKHYEYQQDALDKIRLLRTRIGREDGLDVGARLDAIFKDFDDKVEP